MYPVSDRFLEEIQTSHHVYSYVDVVGPNLETRRVEVVSGGSGTSSVTVDVTAQILRYCSITMTDSDGTLEDFLVQPGVEIIPFRGVMYSDDTIEAVPLGVMRLASIDIQDNNNGLGAKDITVEGYDRSRTVSRDAFTTPYTIPSGTNILDAIKTILGRTFDGLDYDAMGTSLTTTAPKVYDAQSDPWQACQDLAQSMGCTIFFDVLGRVVVAPPTDIDALPSPAFEYIEGNGCQMIYLEKKYSDDPGYNGVVLTGESVGDSQPPVTSIQWDDEPTSFTYHNGPYGEVPFFVQDENVKTQSDADAAASSILKGMLGFSYQLTLTTLVNPALDITDVVYVKRDRANVNALYAVDGLVIPLSIVDTTSATVTLRQKRVK